jgi:Zn-dependent peptidase ImmA (M78 family)
MNGQQNNSGSDGKAPSSLEEAQFKVLVVNAILSKDTEKAVELVCKKYGVRVPKLKIGVPKGQKKALGVYTVQANTIGFRDQDQFFDPFVVLHELYHCIRSTSGSHRGTEKNADKFAISYIEEYNRFAKSLFQGVIRFGNVEVD